MYMQNLIDSANHTLEVYRSRLLALKQNPCAPMTDIMFYESAIDLLEADIAVMELLDEVNAPEQYQVVTDSWYLVEELCKAQIVTGMRIKWSWKHLKCVWVVDYIKKRT